MENIEDSRLKKIIHLVIPFAMAGVFLPISLSLGKDDPVLNQILIWLFNALVIGWIWYDLKSRGQGWEDFGFSLKFKKADLGKRILQSLLVLIITVAAFFVGSTIMLNLGVSLAESDLSGYEFLKGNPLILIGVLLAVYIGSSFAEEAFYRAFLITRFQELFNMGRAGKHIAVVLGAIIFGFAHFAWGPMGIVQTTFMGLALGYCFLKFGRNLWVVILAHIYMDTILMLQIYFSG
jgi:CAAX protease family protein